MLSEKLKQAFRLPEKLGDLKCILPFLMMILVSLLGIFLLKMVQFERLVMQKALANLGDNPTTFTNIRLEIKRLKQFGDKDIRGFCRSIWILAALMAVMLFLTLIVLFQAA